MEPIKEVSFERVYEAAPEVVWKAWTDPGILKQWWGPNDVSIPECEVDLKVGGQFYIVMEAGEAMGPFKGTRWPMKAEYTVVEPNAKLAYTAKAWTEGKEETTFIDQTTEMVMRNDNGKTTVSVKAAIYNLGPDAKMAAEGMQYGFAQQLDKLEKFLAASGR